MTTPTSTLEPLQEWRSMLLISARGAIIECSENVHVVIKHDRDLSNLFGYESHSGQLVLKREPPWGGQAGHMQVEDYTRAGRYFAQHLGLPVTRISILRAGIVAAAREALRHARLTRPESDVAREDALTASIREKLASWDGREATVRTLLEEVIGFEPAAITDRLLNKVGKMLSAAGCVQSRPVVNGVRKRVWSRPVIEDSGETSEELH